MRSVRSVWENSTLNIMFKVAHGSHGSHGFFFVASNEGFSFCLSVKTPKELKIREIREIRVGNFNIPHSALKDSITNLSKLAL